MIQTPDDLKQYDPKIYELLGRVYPDHRIPIDAHYGKNINLARGSRAWTQAWRHFHVCYRRGHEA